MPFVMSDLQVLGDSTSNNMWSYTTPDTIDVVMAANYFNAAGNKLRLNDRVLVAANTGATSTAHILRVSATGAAVTMTGWSAAAAQAAAPAGGTGATAGAYDTAGNRDAMIALVNQMRDTLIAIGAMKGAA